MTSLLWNPFEKYTEKQLIIAGTLATIPLLVMVTLFRTSFDGAFDLHFYHHITWKHTLFDAIVNTTAISLFVYIAGVIVNRKTRLVDVLAATVIARLPWYLTAGFNCTGYFLDAGNELQSQTTAPDYTELLVFIPFVLVTTLCLVWMIALLYNGFRVASNSRGIKGAVLFTLSLLLAETATKFTPLILTMIK